MNQSIIVAHELNECLIHEARGEASGNNTPVMDGQVSLFIVQQNVVVPSHLVRFSVLCERALHLVQ